jgi:3-hydroxyacyl-CoA dehydrogenase
VGANLFMIAMAAGNKDFRVDPHGREGLPGRDAAVKYATVPVVVAPYGMTLGGGLELCFACDSVQAAAETYAGLVEVGVGIIPGGAGTLNMLWRALRGHPRGRHGEQLRIRRQVFKNIALAKVGTSPTRRRPSASSARPTASPSTARQLAEAKARAIGIAASGYHPPIPKRVPPARGERHRHAHMMVDTLEAGGYASAHDAKIAKKLATVLCGGARRRLARGDRGRDPRAGARGLREPLRRAEEHRAHPVHADEQQAPPELGGRP